MTNTSGPNRLMKATEVAALLGVSVPTLRYWRTTPMSDPGLPHLRISSRIIRYERDAVEEFYRKSRKGASDD